MSRLAMVLAAAGLAACGPVGQPVPVLGDARLLEGEWEGEYRSEASGRFGTILFRLAAGADTARGDVVMIPAIGAEALPSRNPGEVAMRQRALPLGIAFVSCEEGEVSGRLESYRDPETGSRVETVFLGRLARDRLEGTFTSYYEDGTRVTGRWWAVRHQP